MQLEGRDKIKLLFLINSLEGGGAEKVLVKILTNLSNETFLFDVALLKKKGVYVRDLEKITQIYDLGVNAEKIGKYIPSVVKRLINLEKKYDVVISFMWESNIINLLASLFSKKRRILGEHINLIRYIKSTFHGYKVIVARWLTRSLYKKANLVITPSEGLKEQLVNFFELKDDRVRVIPNPIDLEEIRKLSREEIDIDYPYVIFVGRLHKQKNIPLLLSAFENLEMENMKLLIVGEGAEKENLIRLTKELGISEKVVFIDFQENPYKYMNKAICLVLPSYYESFANVVVEAMACGCAVISTDCPFGPSEIIKNGENGILVPVDDTEALREALTKVILDKNLREMMIKNGYRTSENFDVKSIVKLYEKAIIEAVS